MWSDLSKLALVLFTLAVVLATSALWVVGIIIVAVFGG